MSDAIEVTVRDLKTGETETVRVAEGDYLLTCAEPCHMAHVQAYPTKGTHVITIKDHAPIAGTRA